MTNEEDFGSTGPSSSGLNGQKYGEPVCYSEGCAKPLRHPGVHSPEADSGRITVREEK